jgi:hypothetical protein
MSETDDYKILNVSETAFKDFQKIMKISAFKKITDLQNKHPFILAVALGFKYEKYSPLTDAKKHSGGYCRVETLTVEEKAVIKAIAINKTKDINTLGNIKQQYQIAEAYANGGLAVLKKLVDEPGDFFVNLTKEFE